jgi:hypothetical protein
MSATGPDVGAKPADKLSSPPVGRVTQLLSDIADQAPLYGLSGALLAVGLITGRRALARSGATMMVNQLAETLARSVKVRAEPSPPDEPAKVMDAGNEAPPPARPSTAKLATGAVIGVAAAAAGGWLLSRLLAKSPAEERDEFEG